MQRTYLDWNATAPLRREAKQAMINAMDLLGNPSSVHNEGRQAKALLERARQQVAQALDTGDADIVFTSSATEAAFMAMGARALEFAPIEHDAIAAHAEATLPVAKDGTVTPKEPQNTALQLANSETGVLQNIPAGLALCDMTQAFGKLDVSFRQIAPQMAIVSAHKLGGPKGVGALILQRGCEIGARIVGGGQEQGRRSGTENLIGIAGFGEAAAACVKDVKMGKWSAVEKKRNLLESTLESGCSDIIFATRSQQRLPNTTCFAVPGWKAETQVMQIDLAGFAVSAGSACSSGKVKASRVLKAMGFKEDVCRSAIRVSIGPSTSEAEILMFADVWLKKWEKFRAQAA